MSEDILEKQLFEIIRNKDLSEDIKLAKIDMLIRLGADVKLKDTGGRNAIMHAENEEIRKAIIDAVKKRNEKTGENVVIQGFERE